MITSICLTDTHRIELDKYGKFVVDGIKIALKDVPFVRYRFSQYGQKEIDYIKEMKSKFVHSAHLAEVNFSENVNTDLELLDTVDRVIKFLYIPITDNEVLNGFSAEALELLNNLDDTSLDRIMLKDNSNTLHTLSSNKLKKQITDKLVSLKNYKDIGVCQSPLSFDGSNACLTAIRARDLAANYSDNEDMALPSANHECMNTCGCIRYIVVGKDILKSDLEKTTKSTSKDTTKSTSKAAKKKFKGILKW